MLIKQVFIATFALIIDFINIFTQIFKQYIPKSNPNT